MTKEGQAPVWLVTVGDVVSGEGQGKPATLHKGDDDSRLLLVIVSEAAEQQQTVLVDNHAVA